MKDIKMKKLLTILFITLTNLMFAQCSGVQSYTISPPPVNGQYAGGTVLTVCYQMVGWNGLNVGSNWVEGFDINLSSSLTPPTPQAPPANCDGGGGSWVWIQNTTTSSNTGITVGPGWFFEIGVGGPIDGNPGNDWGDYGDCVWEFCFNTTVIETCTPANINIDVTVGADGTWGSWSQNSCVPVAFNVFNGTNIPLDFESIVGSPLVQIACIGDSTTFTIIDTTNSSTFTPANPLTVVWNSPGIQQISIIEENYAGCLDTTEFTVDVKPLPVITVEGPDTLCANDSPAQLQGTPIGGVWSIGGSVFNPQSGSGWVGYSYVDGFGCENSDSTFINVFNNPTYSNIIGIDNIVNCSEEDRMRQYYVTQTEGSSYIWNLNGDSLDVNNNIVYVYFPNISDYSNTLQVYEINQYGCVGPVSNFIVFSEKCGEVYIPNTFSPDNDNINDVFKITTVSKIDDFGLLVFSRWGTLLYSFKDQYDQWDGDNLPIGVYVYKVKGRIGRNRIDRMGNVNLVR